MAQLGSQGDSLRALICPNFGKCMIGSKLRPRGCDVFAGASYTTELLLVPEASV
jgi:hypothetical protein